MIKRYDKLNMEKIKKYAPKTAGSLMTAQVPLVFKEQTIGEVQKLIFEKMKEFETINYVYVIDENRKLIGVFSLKEVFQKPKDSKVKEIMEKNLISCQASADQERVAILALKNNLKAIPVVDKEEKFLGVVPSDIILDVLHQEHVEDILLAGGLSKVEGTIRELTTAKAGALVRFRLPWLLLGLLGGVFAAQIIGFFENILKSQLLLALFIPIIVYMSDAVATQTETLIIRRIAIDSKLNIKKYFLREIKIGSFLALILGAILGIFATFWWQNSFLGMVLVLAMFFSISLSVIVAMSIPLILQKFRKDPALGSGPFATIITDILSIAVYFITANFLLQIF
ncbi:MAG: magnesium transporter [Patescibacteria group bacterium]|nr:magnesium transporter [Patescibacteria group bacterium]